MLPTAAASSLSSLAKERNQDMPGTLHSFISYRAEVQSHIKLLYIKLSVTIVGHAHP